MELTLSERDIMKCLWSSEKPLSVSELHEMLCEKFNREWTYKTVASFLLVMRKKEYVTYEKEKRQFLYSPTISEKEYQDNRVKYLKDYWFNGNSYEMLVSCVKEDLVDAETLAKFKEYLK